MMKKGFTIVELMMVIAIIAILMGIVTTAASESIKASRDRKADVLCTLVQTGLATYYEQRGEWPVTISVTGNQAEGKGDNKNADNIELTAAQVRQCVKALVDETKNKNPMMDISGLFVSRSPGERNSGAAFGLDFMSAIRGTKKSPKKMKTAEMYYGYPESSHGWFRRFRMTYSVPGDTITVSKQAAESK